MNRRQSMLPQESQPEVLVRGFHVPRSSPREDARNNSQTASTPNPHDRGPSGTPPQEAGRTERIDSHDHDASGLPPHAWYAPSRPGHQQDHPESSSSAAYREDLRLHADDPLPKNADRYARQLKQPLYKPFHTAPVAEPPEDHWFHPSNNPEHEWHENPYHMKWRYWKWKGSGPQQQQRTGDPTEERPIHASMCAVPAVVNDEEDWVDEEAVEGSEEEVGAGNQVEEAVSVSADEALFDSEEEIAWTSEDDDIEADTASKRGSFMLESARELIQNCTDTLVPKVFSSLGLV
ncbi:hypothetical protein CC80DRAFT_72687 [Byssothecium circinans]|uniref:Uncharacterized protein n=1 Tax=Byssothecium circinans TaxID=147558 RepID=A0A6A5U570_9PLEO|nr:hypothetical protein CC80DRAFT_72687 [Byssothecium circinans]